MSRTLMVVRFALALAVSVVTASAALATQVTYTSLPIQQPDNHANDIAAGQAAESQFLGTLSSFGTEAYEDVPQSFNPTQNLTFGVTGITAASEFSGVTGPPDLPPGLSYSGNALLEEPGVGTGNNDFMISTPVTAFGTYIDNAGDADADTLSLELQNTVTMTDEIVPIGTVGPDAGEFNIFYFGVTDTDPFNMVTLLLTNADDGVLLDNTTVGSVVPEPSTLALILCGVAIGITMLECRLRRATAIV